MGETFGWLHAVDQDASHRLQAEGRHVGRTEPPAEIDGRAGVNRRLGEVAAAVGQLCLARLPMDPDWNAYSIYKSD